MTIKECYEEFGGDYDDIFTRFRTDARVEKFALMFLKDQSYDTLCSTIAAGDVKEAFRAAHTLKGVCQNLSFTNLAGISHDITEVLRDGDLEKAKEMLPTVTENYNKIVAAINHFTMDKAS
jgi:HPt (histidine-containing phosphotransfer) domain-containing protein